MARHRIVTALALVLGVGIGPAQAAPDPTSWVGTWFKLRGKSVGFAATASGMRRGADAFPVYVKIWAFDAGAETLSIDAYGYEDTAAGWVGRTVEVHVIGGSATDFLGWGFGTEPTITGLAMRLTAKGSKATFKTLGGFSVELPGMPGDPAIAGSLSIKGKRVDESKVPVPPASRLH